MASFEKIEPEPAPPPEILLSLTLGEASALRTALFRAYRAEPSSRGDNWANKVHGEDWRDLYAVLYEASLGCAPPARLV